MKQSTSNFSKNEHFQPPWYAHVGGKKCSFFRKFDVLCFLETSVLRFALWPYYRRIEKCLDALKIVIKMKKLKFYLIFVQNLIVYTDTLLIILLTHTKSNAPSQVNFAANSVKFLTFLWWVCFWLLNSAVHVILLLQLSHDAFVQWQCFSWKWLRFDDKSQLLMYVLIQGKQEAGIRRGFGQV